MNRILFAILFAGMFVISGCGEDGAGIIEPGEWTVAYDPISHKLKIKIEINSFEMIKGTDIIEGSTLDIFIGTVSEDGTKLTAQWTSFPKFYASTAQHERQELPVYASESAKGQIVFKKAVENQEVE